MIERRFCIKVWGEGSLGFSLIFWAFPKGRAGVNRAKEKRFVSTFQAFIPNVLFWYVKGDALLERYIISLKTDHAPPASFGLRCRIRF